MILDKLIEKKDLLAFIHWRKEYLKRLGIDENLPEKKRHPSWKQIQGRIKELEHLEMNIHLIKENSKMYHENISSHKGENYEKA